MTARKPHHVAGLAERAAAERAYMEEGARQTLINSLSGGVDSSVSAAISKAAAPAGALALLLPCSTAAELDGERKQDIIDGQRVADHLGIPAVTVNLSGLWLQAVELYVAAAREMAARSGQPLDETKLKWAINNLKPTLRMMTAGFFADTFAGLMMGTDNAIENFLGYFSIRGDGVADRQPIRDCTKAEVRELAAEAGLPADLVNRTPTAGLWPGQTDEDELGFSYAQADALFVWLLERHLAAPLFDDYLTVTAAAVPGILAAPDLPVPRAAAERIMAVNRRTAFKRRLGDTQMVLEKRRLI